MLDLGAIHKEYNNLLQFLSDPELISDWKRFEELSKRKVFLEKIIEKEKELNEVKNKIEENKEILKANEDSELTSLAEAEFAQLIEKKDSLEKELKNILSEDDGEKSSNDPRAAIIEIRAGAGGEEASLFVSDLFKMYSNYAASQRFNLKVLDSHHTELGGFKEIIFELKPARIGYAEGVAGGNGDVFSKLKYEAGVHRVQRIPETEKNGRIHTSTASVAVLPKPKKSKIQIRTDELKIDTYRASGPGGQNVNRRETAVRITHLPTGLVVTSQTERNQLSNKENALAILEVRLLENKEQEETSKLAGKRKIQIGQAKRAEKIRTYNFPQNRVTDHRIKKSWHNIEEIMDGKLDQIINSLKKNEKES